MERSFRVVQGIAWCLGLVLVVLGTLACPQFLYADPTQVNTCMVYCARAGYPAGCTTWCLDQYGCTCSTDCNNCGGDPAPKDTTGSHCGGNGGSICCGSWCVCACTQDLSGIWHCLCNTGPYSSPPF
jgi:hypothetical protein